MNTPRHRGGSSLLKRILLVNMVPLVLLVAALLYLDQYQSGLLEAEVQALRQQARVFAAALEQSAVKEATPGQPTLVPDLSRPLLHQLAAPTPNLDARLYAPDGQLITDSRVQEGPGGAITTTPLPPPVVRGPLLTIVGWLYDHLQALLPQSASTPVVEGGPGSGGLDWAPDFKAAATLISEASKDELPPYVRRTQDGRLLVTVAEPVMSGGRQLIGIMLLTREAVEVVNALFAIRLSILEFFSLALALTVIMSIYLSRTIARPILRLALAAEKMREGRGRTGAVPRSLRERRDEVGVLARALADSAAALWTRLDAIERFAADVAHEIKNPLSSIRSAIETMPRITNREQQQRLFTIMADDVGRLDRLISDISEASRLDAEMSRTSTERVDVAPILSTLAELHETTRQNGDPYVVVEVPENGLIVEGVEGRLVQVLRNLIGNAVSFSPREGHIRLTGRITGNTVEVAVEDQGPGIPESKLEHIFDRFYSERPEGEEFGRHSGLGLSISRQIVETFGGRISAENRRDANGAVLGARFVLRLPRGEIKLRQGRQAASTQARGDRRGQKLSEVSPE
ncbi:MAG TPA: stimulus-sensing domain-containing protein [Acetobacteraceae bacterium]|nr:stimulus-sensing domain-containing protein [Acetobacteraceae bacterium]